MQKKIQDDAGGNAAYSGSAGRELTITARLDHLPKVMEFVTGALDAAHCPPMAEMQITVAVEEIFVNIANYAYSPQVGEATVRCTVEPDPLAVIVQFIDGGVPYNPLQRDDPDITLNSDEREVGGLGILMVKKSMDQINYEYRNGRNILTLKKHIEPEK